jgi:hypothetical protein
MPELQTWQGLNSRQELEADSTGLRQLIWREVVRAKDKKEAVASNAIQARHVSLNAVNSLNKGSFELAADRFIENKR